MPAIDEKILSAIFQLEEEGVSQVDIWTETRLDNGDWIRATPDLMAQGPRYDWATIRFRKDDKSRVFAPSKILSIYRRSSDTTEEGMRVLLYSVVEKLRNKKESIFGDTRLATHYRLHFSHAGNVMLWSVPLRDVRRALFAIEKQKYDVPIPLAVKNKVMQRSHTVMVVKDRKEWASIFMKWTRALKDGNSMVEETKKNRPDLR